MKQKDIKALFPGVFQRTVRPKSPMMALLEVMEQLHAPSEAILASLPEYFNPYRTPDRFVPYLARWVDMERMLVDSPEAYTSNTLPPFPAGLGRLRDLVARSAELSKWRGTARGLKAFLETATGIDGIVIDERVPGPDGRPQPFHIVIKAPVSAQGFQVLIDRIIRMEKPVYVTYQLVFE